MSARAADRAQARGRLALPVLALLLTALLAGCGEGSSSSSSSAASTAAAVPSSPAAATQTAASGGAKAAVADVNGTPIARAAYAHWLTVEQRGGATSAGHRALGFLLTSQWVLAEAAARHLAISEAEVKRRYEQLTRRSFPKPGQLAAYLARAGESEADLLARVKVEALTARVAGQVSAGQPAARRAAVLAAFERAFHARWKALTSCQPGYVMEDCRQYRGGSENLTAPSPAGAAGAHPRSRGAASGGSSATGAAGGEVYTPPGGFALSSSAFGRNGQIPSRYTCAGAGVSPPVSWSNVPAHAAELFLFAIDLNDSGRNGGIRWVVGGIDPSSSGVAEGQTPPGGVVGTNSAGRAAYGAICPAPGHSDTVELVMYALRKPIALSPGFQPGTAEAQYGHDLLGQAAVTYGVASR